MKRTRIIVMVIIILLIVESIFLGSYVVESHRLTNDAERTFRNGINDVMSLYNLDVNSMNYKDRVYYYSRAVAGLEVATISVDQIKGNENLNTALNLLSEHINSLDIIEGDIRFTDIELYNLMIEILMDIGNAGKTKELILYLESI